MRMGFEMIFPTRSAEEKGNLLGESFLRQYASWCADAEASASSGVSAFCYGCPKAGSAELCTFQHYSAVLNIGTLSTILTSTNKIPSTDEEPQTNANNAYVCATRSGDRERIRRVENRMPVVEQEHPGSQEEAVFLAAFVVDLT
jgi:hypothetical protein